MGRNLACKASAVVDHLTARAVPYVAAVEMALGRTQAGYAHLQAHAARVQAEQARIGAAQARLQAEMAGEQFQDVWMSNRVVVDGPDVRVTGPEHLIVCPRTKVRLAMPAAPQVNIMQDPI